MFMLILLLETGFIKAFEVIGSYKWKLMRKEIKGLRQSNILSAITTVEMKFQENINLIKHN